MLGLPTLPTAPFCPPEVQGSVRVPEGLSGLAKAIRFAGPGLLVAVGYMDPGNWATDIEAGSRFGYALLAVVLLCGAAAILLQSLAMRLGIVTGRDLAQLARDRYPLPVTRTLWLLAEAAIVATDIAEVLGSALALQLLFGCPLWIGILLTAFDTVIVLALKGHGFRELEAIVLGLIVTIALCFVAQLIIAEPSIAAIARGAVPSPAILANGQALYLAVGILGATVMPHNLYLHSAIVQTRLTANDRERRGALHFAGIDTVVSLVLATLVNALILILAGTVFHQTGHNDVAEISDAYHLLEPITGAAIAPVLFGIALFASGQSATLTGTIAGQVVLEGFVGLRIPCWQRRVITRGLALAPALAGVLLMGDAGVGRLIVLTQVVLSLQLPFALAPLIAGVSDRRVMGGYAIGWGTRALSWIIFALIVAADLWLVVQMMAGR